MTDLFRLLDRLEPPQDGESPVRHRTGTVDAVNSDGTVDLDLGGVVVDSVAALAGAFIAVGATVQVAVWRGDLLVLGAVRTANQGGPLGVLGYAEVTSNQALSSKSDLTGLSVTVDVAAGRRLRITGSVRLATDNAGGETLLRLLVQEGTTELQARESFLGSSDDRTSIHAETIITPSAGAHTYKLVLDSSFLGTVTSFGTTGRFPFILVEGLGPA